MTLDKYLDLANLFFLNVEHKGDGDTDCSWDAWKRKRREIGG